jgi:hypothetical protein
VGQFYYEGAYELLPDDALIVEAKVPDKCSYWSVILTNDIYETTDWYNNQSSLNDHRRGSTATECFVSLFRPSTQVSLTGSTPPAIPAEFRTRAISIC